ncbi:MAG: hypothetical protein ABJM26_04795 [Anderseniella sp.]
MNSAAKQDMDVRVYWRHKSIDALSSSELRTAIEELLCNNSAHGGQHGSNDLFAGLAIGIVLGGVITTIAAIPVLAF